jgi:hypothetical protein
VQIGQLLPGFGLVHQVNTRACLQEAHLDVLLEEVGLAGFDRNREDAAVLGLRADVVFSRGSVKKK